LPPGGWSFIDQAALDAGRIPSFGFPAFDIASIAR
jgi:hypothetical protein